MALWMFVSQLCDVGWRIHDALIERHVSQERKMLIFAPSDIAQRLTINSIKPIASLLTKTLPIVVPLSGVSPSGQKSFDLFISPPCLRNDSRSAEVAAATYG